MEPDKNKHMRDLIKVLDGLYLNQFKKTIDQALQTAFKHSYEELMSEFLNDKKPLNFSLFAMLHKQLETENLKNNHEVSRTVVEFVMMYWFNKYFFSEQSENNIKNLLFEKKIHKHVFSPPKQIILLK